MSKTTRARYTLEFKLEAVKAGQSVAAVAATLDVPAQSISNWVKAEQEGKLGGAGTKPISPGADGIVEAARRSRTPKDGARYFKKSVRVLREGVDVKYAFC
jgi:transposase-like protein